MAIKITKSTFKKVPEGRQELFIEDVELVPSGKPQKVIFHYKHQNGATMKETLDFNKEVPVKILGSRCDVLYDGKLPEGTEIEPTDLPEMFLNKIATCMIKYKEVGDKTYVNIGWVESYRDGVVDKPDVADEDDDL